jgi:cytochrome c-type biogenesis protein CcmH/NrfG
VEKRQMEEAEQQVSEIIRYRPDFTPAHLDLGTALVAQGKRERALAEFHAILQLDPANVSARQQINASETAPPQNR